MGTFAWLIVASLEVLLIFDELGRYLEVFKFFVVRCRIVKGLLLISAQYKLVHLL